MYLDISHTWVGDLGVNLTGPGCMVSGIIDRPGAPASTFGCSGSDILVTLDDESGNGDVELGCDPAVTPAIAGNFQPTSPLSACDGAPVAGDWTLTVTDSVGGDSGRLNEWCLVFDRVAPTPVAVPASGRWGVVALGALLLGALLLCTSLRSRSRAA